MAIVKMKPLYGSVQRTIDYICNPNKTEIQTIYSSSNPDPSTVGLQWNIKYRMSKHKKITMKDIGGYHLIMSFDPKEKISYEQVYDLSMQWIREMFGNEFDFVLSVHRDTPHKHAHIILNPTSNFTQKNMRMYFKRDVPVAKYICNRICKEAGFSTLEQVSGQQYYQWTQKTDSAKDIIRKTLDACIQKVKSYDDLKAYLQSIGFQIKDSYQSVDEGEFIFTVNEKLILKDKSKEGKIAVRLPNQFSYYTLLDEKDFEWVQDHKAIRCSINILENRNRTVYAMDTDEDFKITSESFKSYFDDKTKKQNTCSITVPYGRKPIRTNGLQKNKKGEGYSLDEIIQRIEQNGRTDTDQTILNIIQRSNNDSNETEKDRLEFFTNNGIRIPWNQTSYSKPTKYQRYVKWKTNELQKTLDRIHEKREFIASGITYDDLLKELAKEKREFDQITKELRINENKFSEIEASVMEGVIEVSLKELEKWIDQNITVLQNRRLELKEEYATLTKKIKRFEELGFVKRSENEEKTKQNERKKKEITR